jgi:hypothetical protein
MFFHPLSVDNTNFQHPDNLPLRPEPHIPTHVYQDRLDVSKDLPQRLTSTETRMDPTGNLALKTPCGVKNGSFRETQRNLASLKPISLSHGNLLAINNQNIFGDRSSTPNEGFVAVKNRIRSATPKECHVNENVSVNSNFVNSFRRYSVPSVTLARALSLDQLQRLDVPEEPSQDTSDCPAETKPPALPPRPPKPARFHKGDRQRSRHTQESTALVRRYVILLY